MTTKTTVYLPDDLKRAVEFRARQEGMSEAEVIRSAIRAHVEPARPRARAGILRTDEPMAHRVDELLAGFGTP